MKHLSTPLSLLFLAIFAGCTRAKEMEVLAELDCTFSMLPVMFFFIVQLTLVILLYALTSKGAKKGMTIANFALMPFNGLVLFYMSSFCFNDYNSGRQMPTFYLIANGLLLVAIIVALILNNKNKKTI